MHGSIDRTNVFTRGRFAMLAEHRLSHGLGIINPRLELLRAFGLERFQRLLFLRVSGVVTIDANPVHFPSAGHLVFADNGDVVFALAGHHTGRAADAQI